MKARASTRSRSVLSSLSARCLRFVSECPGSSGTQVRDGLEIRHLSQASRLLSRLEREGLVYNDAGPGGRVKAWELTERGESVLREHQDVWGIYD